MSSSPTTPHVLARYSSPLRSPLSPSARSPSALGGGGTVTSPRRVFTDSEYVANRISVAAKEVEIRTLKSELAATQRSLDSLRADSVIKDTELQDHHVMAVSDQRRRAAEHDVQLQQVIESAANALGWGVCVCPPVVTAERTHNVSHSACTARPPAGHWEPSEIGCVRLREHVRSGEGSHGTRYHSAVCGDSPSGASRAKRHELSLSSLVGLLCGRWSQSCCGCGELTRGGAATIVCG